MQPCLQRSDWLHLFLSPPLFTEYQVAISEYCGCSYYSTLHTFSSYNNSFSHWTFSNIVFLTSFLLSFSQCILLLFTYFNYFLSSYFLKLHSSEIKFFIFSIVLAARIISVFFCMWSVLVIFIFLYSADWQNYLNKIYFVKS